MCGIFFHYSRDKTHLAKSITNADRIRSRGPDKTIHIQKETYVAVFHRLSINGVGDQGDQPFITESGLVMCNGELYCHKRLREKYNFPINRGDSDCSYILPAFNKMGIRFVEELSDSEFAMIIIQDNRIYIARDHVGIRPLFIGYDSIDSVDRGFALASEAKALCGLYKHYVQFPPGVWMSIELGTLSIQMERFSSILVPENKSFTRDNAHKIIRDSVIKSVMDRYALSEVPVGAVLSGGLDSFLVTYIISKERSFEGDNKISTFTIGLSDADSSDIKAARLVAKILNTDHHEVFYTIEEGLKCLKDVIYTIESWCTTTVRASIPMYLLAKYIASLPSTSPNKKIKTLLSGEGSDEIFMGYMENHDAPNAEEALKNAEFRIKNIHYYDGLRADRTLARWGLEVRPPFLASDVIKTAFSIPTEYKLPTLNEGIEKRILRDAFDPYVTEPELKAILYRPKEAFSDAVGSKWRRALIDNANRTISDSEFNDRNITFPVWTPDTKEDYLYRKIHKEFFPSGDSLLPFGKWMPRWSAGEHNGDPSATVLKSYTKRMTNSQIIS